MLLITTLATISLLLLLWLVIQRAWQRSFPEIAGNDALAGQFRCGNCGCGSVCERTGEDVTRETGGPFQLEEPATELWKDRGRPS